MNRLGKLTAFQLCYYFKPRFESKKDRNKFIGIVALLGLCFIMPLIMMIGTVYMGTSIAIKNNILPELLSSLFAGIELGTIVLGTMTYINTMYFSKDNSLLQAMPIKSIEIYISKMSVCLLSMLGISSLLAIPSIITTGVAMYQNGITPGIEYYLLGIWGLLTLPLIALLVISILVIPVMKVVSFLKKRPVLFSVVSVLFTLAVMVLMYSFMFMLDGEDGDMMAVITTMTAMGRASYVTLVMARAMVGVDIGVNIAIYMGILIGSVLISLGLSVLLYRNTLTRLDEGGMTNNLSKADTKIKKDRPIIADIKREMRIVMRCPDLFVQTIMMVLIAPILIVVFSLFGNDMPTEEGGNMALFFTSMVFFYECVTMGLNYLASIGISREREMLAMLKTMPISPKDIIKAKMLLADIVTCIIGVLCTITYVCCTKDTPWFSSVFMLVLVSAQGMSLNAYSLYRDVKKPNLRWVTVREITKNNFSSIVPMFISMGAGILLTAIAGGVSFAKISNDMQFLIFWLIALAVEVVFYFVFRWKKIDKMAKIFSEIEA